MDELEAIVERAKIALTSEDHEKLKAAMETFAYLTEQLEAKGVSIQRLRRILFGPSTEKTSKVCGNAGSSGGRAGGSNTDSAKPGKRKGHGRNGAAAYRGATRVVVPHGQLQDGQRCPGCGRGTLRTEKEPKTIVRLVARAPIHATVYEMQRLRCSACRYRYTAATPPGVGEEKYDETVPAMTALLRYGSGMPSYRLEHLEEALGIPFPMATQYELVSEAADKLKPVHAEHIRQGAQGEILHNDDTGATILDLLAERRRRADDPELQDKKDRTGIFTTSIISVVEDHRIALFFTGANHAGENLARVLKERASGLGPPVQMCDALSRNLPKSFVTILANCLAHGRRQFVDVAAAFPTACRYVLELLGEVYAVDEKSRQRGMSSLERLAFHQEHSAPKLEQLQTWMKQQLDERLVEPNSGLGKAIRYMQNHWEPLTKFLRVAGAPLDNNIAERALKRAIMHRKNSLFYKTQNGADVGDLFMTLIHTAELNGADPFDYLTTLLRNGERLKADPSRWMPWNYLESVAAPADG
jgi:transposase